ncbi:hypothetical protein EAF00_003084 [Botryotinia globosa]|nr:hypothetical protein EAF00_003084 [Botryotinia globosa]
MSASNTNFDLQISYNTFKFEYNTDIFASYSNKSDTPLSGLLNLLHTPAEQRSTRVLDLCFFALAHSFLPKEYGPNYRLAKSEDFNAFELRLHLAERSKESEAEVHGKIEIGARSFIALTWEEKKQFLEAMEKLIEGPTLEIDSSEGYHLPGVHCSTRFEKEIKNIKKWIEEQSKEKMEEV